MEEYEGKNEGLEVAEIPTFLKNFITFAKSGVNLQQNYARYANSQTLVDNIVENSKGIADFELEWAQLEINNTPADEYPEIRAAAIQRKTDISDAHLQYQSRVDPADPDIFHFCNEFLDTWGPLCEVVCLNHEEAAMGYIARVELNVGFASRALDICHEAIQSKDTSQISAKFQLATSIIARLAESCSMMAVQASTSQQVSDILNGHFNSLGDQNEGLAAKINAYFSARDNKEEAHRNMLLAIETLMESAESITTLLEQEREKLETQDLFMAYKKEIFELREMIRIQREAQEIDEAAIKELGSGAGLAHYAEQTGIEPTKALSELAHMNDDIGLALLSIHHKIAEGNANDVISAVNKAAPKLLELPLAAKAYIAEREVELAEMATTIKKNLAEDEGQFQDILENLRKVEKCEDSKEALQLFEESQTKTEEIMSKVINDLTGEDPQMLGNARFDSVKEETAGIRQEIKEIQEDDDADQIGKTRRLTNAVSRVQRKLKNVEAEVEQTASDNTQNFKEINDKIDRSIINAHNQLIKATNDMVKSGGKNTSELAAVCEDLSTLVELSASILPFQTGQQSDVAKLKDEEDEEMEDNSSSLSGMHEPKNAAQLKLEKMEKRQSKRLSSSLVNTVRQSMSLELSKVAVTNGETPDPKEEFSSFVKSQVHEIEVSLQLFEQKLPKKSDLKGPRRTRKGKTARFADITEEISQTPENEAEEEEEEEEVPKPSTTAAVTTPVSIWDETGGVRFETVGTNEVVRAGTLNQLVLHLTAVTTDTMSGTDFFQTFMVTLQTFTTPDKFLEKMAERFRVPPCPPGTDEKKYQNEFRMPIQIKVCSVLKKWITVRYDQDFSGHSELIERFKAFVQEEVSKDYEFLTTNLIQHLQYYTSGDAHLDHQKNSELKGQTLEWEAPAESRKGSDNTLEPFPGFPSMLHFDGKALAQQMTLIDAELFRAIRLHELAGQVWNSKEKETKAPNLLRFINHTNRVSVWIANSILKERDVKIRAKIMSNFITLCSYLQATRNYNGVMAVLAGLSTAAVSRLKETKSYLPAKTLKLSLEQEQLMSSLSSFKNYRDTVKNSPPPLVPFVGILLSDLTFAEDGNPDFITPNVVNWSKRSLLYGMLSELTSQQRNCRYKNLTESPIKRGFMLRLAQQQIATEDLYDLSLKLEPRGRGTLKKSSSSMNLMMTKGLGSLRKLSLSS